MITLDDVAAMAMELPEVTEGVSWGHRTWSVRKKSFVWERPLTKADIKRYGDEPVPQGELVGVRVEDLHEKEAVLEADPKGVFTITHFDNYPAVLIQLKHVGKRKLREPSSTPGWPWRRPSWPRSTSTRTPRCAGSTLVAAAMAADEQLRASHADEAVGLFDQPGDVGWRHPLPAQCGQVVFGRPTGDGAALSDVDRDLMLADLGEQLAGRWQAEALELLTGVGLHELGGVPGEHDADGVSHLE